MCAVTPSKHTSRRTVRCGTRLNEKGRYVGPRLPREALTLTGAQQTLAVTVPDFVDREHLGPLAFDRDATRGSAWIVDADKKKAVGVIVTRLTAPVSTAEPILSVHVPSDSATSSTVKIGSVAYADAPAKVLIGNDVVVLIPELPPANVQTINGKTTIVPLPVVLEATWGGRTVTHTVMLGDAATKPVIQAKPAPGGGGSTTPNDKPAQLSFKRDGFELSIPADKLTPDLTRVLEAAFSQPTQIIIPGMTVQPANSEAKK